MFSAGPSNEDGKRLVLPTAIEQEISHGILGLAQRLHQLQLLSKSEAEEEVVEEEKTADGIIIMSGSNNGATMNFGCTPNEDARRASVSAEHTTINIYINNNVQGVNNSILYNSSCTLRDPGVRFDLSNLERPSVSSRTSSESSDLMAMNLNVPDFEIKLGKERKCTGRKRSWSEVVSEEKEVPKPSLDEACSTSNSVQAQIHGGSCESSVQTEVTSKEVVEENHLSAEKPSKVRHFLRKLCCSTAVMD